MIKKLGEENVFLKLVYVEFLNMDTLKFAYRPVLQAFDTEQESKEYLKQELEKDNCVGGKLLTYAEAEQEFCEDEIISAIELNLASKGLKNR